MPDVLLSWGGYLLLEALHKAQGLCRDAAKLDGSQTRQWSSNPRSVPEVTHKGANPSGCSECYKLILKKKIKKIIITPSLLLLLIPPFLFTVFYL